MRLFSLELWIYWRQEGYGTLLQTMKDYRVFNHASLYTRFKNTIKDIRDRNSIDHNLLIEELEMKIGDVEVYYS